MANTIDELLAEIRSLSARHDSDDLTAKERDRLLSQKTEIQSQARAISASGRHPDSVKRQVETLQARRRAINDLFIKPGYAEKRGGKNIQDPAAYSHNINATLRDKYQIELDDIDTQLAALRPLIAEPDEKKPTVPPSAKER
jgi:D-alanyl-D-alanine carboxypeptidase